MESRNAQVLFIVLILILLTVLVALPVSPVSAQYEGDPAPDFTITDIDGNVFTLSNYRGMVVLLEFFHTLCPNCIKEVDDLKQICAIYGQDVLVILSISKQNNDVLRDFRDNNLIPWRIASDPNGVVFQEYKVATVPTIFIVDQGGCIHFRNEGYTRAATLKAELDSLGIPEFTAEGAFPLFVIVTLAATVLGKKMVRRRGSLVAA